MKPGTQEALYAVHTVQHSSLASSLGMFGLAQKFCVHKDALCPA